MTMGCRRSTGCATAARTGASSSTLSTRERIERRKVLLIRLLAKAGVGLQANDHIVQRGDVVFRHACQLGFEGIVSKRLGSRYHSGRSRHWVKIVIRRAILTPFEELRGRGYEGGYDAVRRYSGAGPSSMGKRRLQPMSH
jgi:hypothetical protein